MNISDFVGGAYGQLWLVYWPLGLLVIAILAVLILKGIKRSIVAATQLQLVHLVMNGRYFFIDHPNLAEQERGEPEKNEFYDFVRKTGDWPMYFLRRNIITSLELLYFQKKYKALDKAFFVSHCNHIKVWFQSPNFLETWHRTKSLHVPEFQKFVEDFVLADSGNAVKPF